jgi:hypothetical protein
MLALRFPWQQAQANLVGAGGRNDPQVHLAASGTMRQVAVLRNRLGPVL